MTRGKGKEGNVRIIRQEGSLLTDPGRLEGGKTGGGNIKRERKTSVLGPCQQQIKYAENKVENKLKI